MMGTWVSLVLLVTGGLALCGYLVALAYSASRWRDYPRPTRLLFIAILLVFLSMLLNSVVPILATRVLSPNQFGMLSVVLGALRTVIQLVSLALMVAAVYVDRRPSPATGSEFLPGDAQSAPSSANPFETPH